MQHKPLDLAHDLVVIAGDFDRPLQPCVNREVLVIRGTSLINIDMNSHLVRFREGTSTRDVPFIAIGPAYPQVEPHEAKAQFERLFASMVQFSKEYGSDEIIIGPELLRKPTRISANSLAFDDIGVTDSRANECWFRWDRVYAIIGHEFTMMVIHASENGQVMCREFAADIDWWNILS